jgi:MFS family permease
MTALAPSNPGQPLSGRRMLGRLWVLMATVFTDMVGFLIVLPLLPFYAERFGASPSVIGYMVAAFALMQLLTSPLWGHFSDRRGRRPMILLGLGISAAAFTLFGLVDPIAGAIATAAAPGDEEAARLVAGHAGIVILFLSRLVQGAGGGTTSVVQAYISDSVGAGQRAKALGWVTAATSAGVMIGPVLGSQAFRLGPSAPGLIAAALCLLNLGFAWRLLPEPERHDQGDDGAPAASLLRAIADVARRPTGSVASLIWIYSAGMMAFMAMNAMLALYLNRAFGITEENIGWFYTYVGGISLVMRALLLGPIVTRFGELTTLRVGLVCLAGGLAALPLPGSLWTLALVVLLVPVGTALLFPSTTSLVAGRSRRRQTGQTLGVQQTFGGVARLVGPLWSGVLFERLGIASPFWVASALVLAVGLFSFTVKPGVPAPDAAAAEAPLPAD